jgi:hypothetical protein
MFVMELQQLYGDDAAEEQYPSKGRNETTLIKRLFGSFWRQ